jgi:hypothetical protein
MEPQRENVDFHANFDAREDQSCAHDSASRNLKKGVTLSESRSELLLADSYVGRNFVEESLLLVRYFRIVL